MTEKDIHNFSSRATKDNLSQRTTCLRVNERIPK